MDQIVTGFLLLVGVIILVGLFGFGIVSYFEKERRAMQISLGTGIVGGAIFFGLAASPQPIPQIAFWGVILLGVIFIILFFLPIGKIDLGNDIPHKRFDEREIVFARARLEPGTPNYETYYREHPDHEAPDRNTRAKPGIFAPNSKFANEIQFIAGDSSFLIPIILRDAVNGSVATKKKALPPEKMTTFIKGLTKYYGALEVGITPLKPYHVYSHIGRGAGKYGAEIPVEHAYAIAYTVEMDYDMVGTAPLVPTAMETGKQYAASALVGVELAETLRNMGYPARAHIDGNYRVIAPLIARDAGLGEIGRMTLFMSEKEGPRLRLGVVTTSAPLIPDEHTPDEAVIDFCTICEKCAHACPSKSIPLGPREEIDGALRWQLNADTCYRYWNVAGTDCAKCMAVCPYSHPNNLAHNIVRWGIARSGFFRRLALWLDDVFYGKIPEQRPIPEWVDVP